ncbi:uncharacterized protein [Atheta coriaria]|uniref:uncharacterized protein n=1 Tax=Dalotia coriaria TaxID=877792 RepID=UPI0031F39C3F
MNLVASDDFLSSTRNKMAKLLLIFALCLSSTLAVPNFKFSRSSVALTRLASQLKSVDHGFEVCFQPMVLNIIDALLTNYDQMLDCSRDITQELLTLEEEIVQSTEVASFEFYAKLRDYEACGSDEACKTAAMKDIVDFIAAFVQELRDIVDKHLTSLAGKLPEGVECFNDINLALVDAIKKAGSNFMACINETDNV